MVYTFSSLSRTLDRTLALFQRSGKRKDGKEQDSAPRLTRKRDILLAFVIVSLPLLFLAILLLAFIFLRYREEPNSFTGTWELPLDKLAGNAFYSSVDLGDFLLISTWASNVAEIVVAPFMILFSYTVAREILQHRARDKHDNEESQPRLLREIMRGAHVGVWHWVAEKTSRRPKGAFRDKRGLRVVDMAGIGLFTATLLTILVIVGDNWLHASTERKYITHYNYTTNYTQNHAWFPPDSDFYQAGFSPAEDCTDQLNATLSSNAVPCSLTVSNGTTNLALPSEAYLTLGTGISQISSNFDQLNLTQLQDGESKGTGTNIQVVTYTPRNAAAPHSLLFYPDSAASIDKYGFASSYGIDYVANTTSMVTQCTFVTQECDVHGEDTNSTDTNEISVPFNCYPDFSGNLGHTPATGHERAQGWNTSFYQLVNGTPTNIPLQAKSNPFHFYAAAAVNSVDLQDFPNESNRSEGNPGNGSLVDAGHGFVAFALSCTATVYDVTFSLIDGSFVDFNHSLSTPQKASIIQAPLQVGFGSYHLYQSALLAVVDNTDSVAASMAKAFSQTGMALASGAFDFDNNIQQRFRWSVQVTYVPKAPFFYLVAVCLTYSVLGMGMAILALHLRRMPEVRAQQARLMDEWAPQLLDMDRQVGEEEEEEEEKRRKRERGWRDDDDERGGVGSARGSSDIVDM